VNHETHTTTAPRVGMPIPTSNIFFGFGRCLLSAGRLSLDSAVAFHCSIDKTDCKRRRGNAVIDCPLESCVESAIFPGLSREHYLRTSPSEFL
jgi:hypothetical protein